MSPFDRAHTTSYSTLIETTRGDQQVLQLPTLDNKMVKINGEVKQILVSYKL